MAKMKRPDYIEVWRQELGAGDWLWTRWSANGRIVGASIEGYRSRKRCVENAKRVMQACEVKVVK